MEVWQRCFRVKKGSTINNLPDECLQEIFSRASLPLGLSRFRDSLNIVYGVRHSLHCAIVCKRWQAAVDPAVESLHFDINAPDAEALIKQTPRFINLTRITMSLWPGLGPTTVTDLLVALAASTPQLEELILQPSRDQSGLFSALANCLPAWTRVRNLTLVDFPGGSEEESLALLDTLGQIPSLQELEVIVLDSDVLLDTVCQWLAQLAGIPVIKMNTEKAPPPGMTALTNLKELTIEYFGVEHRVLDNTLGALRSLTGLKLEHASIPMGLPDSIGNLTALRRLVLETCHMLTMLPGSLGNLQALNHLEINCMDLAELPESIGELHQLNHLVVYGDSLRMLPDSVSQLKELTVLALGFSSELELLPCNVGALSNLRVLDIRSCPLQELPGSVCQLACLSRLTASLCFDLMRLPLHIGRLQALMELHLHGNRWLEVLPDGIADLRSLTTLDISGCPKLHHLPKLVTHLTRLENLKIHQSTPEVQKHFLSEDAVAAFQGLRELSVAAGPVEGPWLPPGMTRLSGLERLEVWGKVPVQQPQGARGRAGILGVLGGMFKSWGESRYSSLPALRRLQHLTLETSSHESPPHELLKMPALMRLTWHTTPAENFLPSATEVVKALRGKGCRVDINW